MRNIPDCLLFNTNEIFMKLLYPPRLLAFLLPALLLFSCQYSEFVAPPQTEYQPVYMSREALEGSIALREPRDLVNTSKVYAYQSLVFVIERYEGVHIIRNNDPANPVNIGFIRIPGCQDVAVKDDILYADNAMDLVAIDISNPADIRLTKRIQNALPWPTAPGFDYIPANFQREADQNDVLIVKWTKQ